MSKEYIAAVALVIGGILKSFGVEIPDDTVEGILFGAVALFIAVRRKQRGDIDVFGRKAY